MLDYRDISQFVKPADVRDIISFANDPLAPTEKKLLAAFDHLNGILTPVIETALVVELRDAIEEYVEVIGPRPEKTGPDLEEWQRGFDTHLRAAFSAETLEDLGEGWCDTYLVNSDLDTDADLVRQAARVGADAILDAALRRTSKNKMLSAVDIVPGRFDEATEQGDFGTNEADRWPASDAPLMQVGDILDNQIDGTTVEVVAVCTADDVEDDFGIEAPPPVAIEVEDFGLDDTPTLPPAPTRRVRQVKPQVDPHNRPEGMPFMATLLHTTNPDALRVLLALREHAADSDSDLAREILKCSRSQVGNFISGKMPFAPTPVQLQQLRDLAFKRAQGLQESLRVTGQ
jgi:hypothetical protein